MAEQQTGGRIGVATDADGRTYHVADAHAHIYPEKIAAKATESVGAFYSADMGGGVGTSERLLHNGSQIGCSRYLVCSVATTLKQVDSISRFISSECEVHPEFVGLGAYHPDVADPVELLDRVEELGLRGIKIHPDFQKVAVDDECLMPLYAELERRQMPILIHMGDRRYHYSNPIQLVHVMDKTPELVVIAAHFGGYTEWGTAEETLKIWPSIYFDTSSSLAFLDPARAAELCRHFGTERMMWGSDFPMWDHAAELERFFALGLTPEENRAILYDNFARLFKLSGE